MLSKKTIITKAKDQKVIRGIDPLRLRSKDIDRCVDIVVDVCKSHIVDRTAVEFNDPWLSRKTMKKKNIYREFSPIHRMDRITKHIISNFQNQFPIDIRHTINKGPEYTYFTSKKDRYESDWVCVPEPERFIESKYYYKILLHELSHAACSRTRLCLKFTETEEEVAVEAAALTICFISGYNLWENCIAYMNNWSYDKNDEKLSINTKRQWDTLKNKTKRIVRYLLMGKDRI